MTDKTARPLDQAPAADPARNALDFLRSMIPAPVDLDEQQHRADLAVDLIRDALADRITPAEARVALGWEEELTATSTQSHDHAERALIARLGRIADRETGR